MMTSSCMKLNNLLYLLVKDSWIIFILFLCDIQQFFLLVCSSNARSFYAPRPLIDRAPGNDATSLTTYTTHSRASDTRFNPVESNYRDGPTGHKKYIITIIGCCVSYMIKLPMITECWTTQSNHRDTFFSIYLACSLQIIPTSLHLPPMIQILVVDLEI